MTTHLTEPHDTPLSRRSPWPWVLAGAVVVATAVAVTLVLTRGDDSQAGNATAASTTPSSGTSDGPYDLSTPEAAAASFHAAAETGSGDTLLSLSCVGSAACVSEHAADVADAQLAEERATIRDGVYELAEHLKGVEFSAPVDGTAPGTKEVPYRTPETAEGAELTLTFVRSEGNWLYYRPMT